MSLPTYQIVCLPSLDWSSLNRLLIHPCQSQSSVAQVLGLVLSLALHSLILAVGQGSHFLCLAEHHACPVFFFFLTDHSFAGSFSLPLNGEIPQEPVSRPHLKGISPKLMVLKTICTMTSKFLLVLPPFWILNCLLNFFTLRFYRFLNINIPPNVFLVFSSKADPPQVLLLGNGTAICKVARPPPYPSGPQLSSFLAPFPLGKMEFHGFILSSLSLKYIQNPTIVHEFFPHKSLTSGPFLLPELLQ